MVQLKKTAGKPGKAFSRILLTAMLVGGLAMGSVSAAYADTIGDLNNQKNANNSKIAANNAQKANDQQNYDSAVAALQQSTADLATAQANLAAVREQVAAAQAEDQRLADQLADAQKKLDAAKAAVIRGETALEAQKRKTALAVQSMTQQNTTLLGVSLLVTNESAADINQQMQWSDTIFNSASVETQKLNQIQTQLNTDKQTASDTEASIAQQKKDAAAHLKTTQDLEAQASAAAATVQQKVAANNAAKQAAASDIAQINAQNDQLAAAQAKIDQQIATEYQRQQAEAAAAAAAAKNKGSSSGNSGSSSNSGSNNSGSSNSGSSSGFIKPVNAPLTSPYGYRIHPITGKRTFHSGDDLGASCGTPIKAAASGTVSSIQSTAQSGGFGNFTIINNGYINGSAYSTGYAHQSKIIVSVGQRVSQGQTIGYVGTTGMSTGCHLHFMIYKNGATTNPWPYIS